MTTHPGRTIELGAEVVGRLTSRGLHIAVAESLTGGLLVSALIRTPGASVVVNGGVVAYNTALKASVLGVDAALLAARGAVDPEVAEQMATRVRTALAVEGVPAEIGISTTGVAGPDPQDGAAVGTVYLGFSIGDTVTTRALRLTGDRDEIRRSAVEASLKHLLELLA